MYHACTVHVCMRVVARKSVCILEANVEYNSINVIKASHLLNINGRLWQIHPPLMVSVAFPIAITLIMQMLLWVAHVLHVLIRIFQLYDFLLLLLVLFDGHFAFCRTHTHTI